MSKSIAGLLPNDRPYTEVEAVYSFELDRNCGNEWSYRGYEKLWGWTYKKTRSFIERLCSVEGLQQIDKRKLANPAHLVEQSQGISRVSIKPCKYGP